MKQVSNRAELIAGYSTERAQALMVLTLSQMYQADALHLLVSQSHRVEVAGYMNSPSEITYRQGVYNAELLDKHVSKIVNEGYNWIEMTLTIYYSQV
jgi:hypothetical protein